MEMDQSNSNSTGPHQSLCRHSAGLTMRFYQSLYLNQTLPTGCVLELLALRQQFSNVEAD